MDSKYKPKAFFRSYNCGLLSIFYAGGSKPLDNWQRKIQNGYINRNLDPELKAMVLEIGGTNVSTTYISCPKNDRDVLGISLPFFVMVVKNMSKYFTFEVTILDDTGARRRFRVANFQSCTQITPLCTVMPIGLSKGWNQIQFNLSDFTFRAYKSHFCEVLRVRINANIVLRRIYCAERLYSEEELPDDYKLFFPLSNKGKPKKLSSAQADKENIDKNAQLDKTEYKAADNERMPSKQSLKEQERSKTSIKSKTSIVSKKSDTSARRGYIEKEKGGSKEAELGSLRKEKYSQEQLDEALPVKDPDEQKVQQFMEHMALKDLNSQTVGGIHIGGGIRTEKVADDVLEDEFGQPIGSIEKVAIISQIKLGGGLREMTERDYRPDDLVD